MTFTVVVPVYNALAYLPSTIPSILEALKRVDGHLVLMDNGSTDGSFGWLEEHAHGAHLESRPGLTIGALRNEGARLHTGDILSFIDADCLVPRDYFERIGDLFAETGAQAVGSNYALPDDALWIERDWHALDNPTGVDKPVHYLPSGNFACRRDVFEEIGGFDEVLETGEDAELCQRLWRSGGVIWESPRIEAKHLGNPKSLLGFFRKQRWHGLGMFGTMRGQFFDKPTLLTLLHLTSTVAGLGLVLWFNSLLGALLFVGGTLLAPALSVGYRTLQGHRPRSFLRALLLFHLYFDARIAALGLILLRKLTPGD